MSLRAPILISAQPADAGAPSGHITNQRATWIKVRCAAGAGYTEFYLMYGDNSANMNCEYVTHVKVVAGNPIWCSTSSSGPFTQKWTTVGWNSWPGTNHLWCWI